MRPLFVLNPVVDVSYASYVFSFPKHNTNNLDS